MAAIFTWLLATIATFASSDDPIDRFIEAQMASQHLPGLSLAVVKDGKVVKAKGYGMANLELAVPASADSVFEIASLTKQFAATAIMMLSHEKKLALDDPASRFIPGFPGAWKDVTVRHLVTHTSGLPDFGDPVTGPRLGSSYTGEQLIAHFARASVKFKPGDQWAYNDFCYFLVGMIIERAAGVPYATYMAEHIFQPLGMTSTQIYNAVDVVPNRVSGYTWKDGRFRRGRLTGQTGTFGGGDILSTATDMAKWDLGLDGDKILPRNLRDQLWTPARLNDGRQVPFTLPVKALHATSFGFGWWIGSFGGHNFAAHGGDISSGFSTYSVRFLEEKLSVFVLINRSQGGNPFVPDAARSWDVAHGVAGFYLPGIKDLVKPD